MTTGSIHDKSLTLSKHKEAYMVFLTLTNNAGNKLNDGEAVYIDGDLTVDRIVDSTDDAQFPIGIVDVAGDDQEHVTVATNFQRTLEAHNQSGGAMAAGELVRPNGTINATGRPEYIDATGDTIGGSEAVGTWAHAVVLEGGADDSRVLLGILRVPVRPLPAAS